MNKIQKNFENFIKDFYALYEKIIKKLEYKDIKEFFKEGFYVGQSSNDFNLFDYTISPWIPEFLNFWKNEKIKWFYLIQGSQTSKTTFLQGILLYHLIFELDCPIMYIVDTGINLSRYISTKIAPLLNANEKRYNIDMLTNSKFELQGGTKNYGIKGMFTKGINSGSRVTHYLIGLNPIYFAIGSMGNLVKSESARLVIGDEVNNWKIGIKQAQIRTRIYGERGRGIFASIPPNEGNKEFWVNIMNSNVYQWWIPCPHCGAFQGWTEKNVDIQQKEIICLHCKKPFPKEKSERKKILNQGKLVCIDYKNRTYKEIEPKCCDSVSLHIPGFYSLFTNWDEQIQNYIDFIGNKISDIDKVTYVKEELAVLPDIADGEQLNLECVKTYLTKNTYKVEDLDLITIGFDVQMKELYYCVSGWKYLKKENKIVIHILDANAIEWKTDAGEVIFQKVLKFISDWAKSKKLMQVVFDLTDGKITHEILTQINHLEPNIFGIKDIGSGYNKAYKDETQAIISKNKEHSRLYLAVSSALKDIIYQNFKELHNGTDYYKTWAINNKVHKKFCYSLTQEWRQIYTVRTTGQERFRWRKIKERGCYNHFFSALAYSLLNFNKIFHHLYQQYNFKEEYYLNTDKMEELRRRNGIEQEQRLFFS